MSFSLWLLLLRRVRRPSTGASLSFWTSWSLFRKISCYKSKVHVHLAGHIKSLHELFLKCGSGTLLTSYKTVLITLTIFVFFFWLVLVRLEEILEGENVPRATSDTTRRLWSEVNSSFCWPYISFYVSMEKLVVSVSWNYQWSELVVTKSQTWKLYNS